MKVSDPRKQTITIMHRNHAETVKTFFSLNNGKIMI